MNKEQIRAVGGITHGDGNIFFTNQSMLDAYVAALAQPEMIIPAGWIAMDLATYEEKLAEARAQPVHLENDDLSINFLRGIESDMAQAVQPAPPHECKTDGEKKAYAFGWWQAMEQARKIEKQEQTAEPVAWRKANSKGFYRYYEADEDQPAMCEPLYANPIAQQPKDK